MFPDLYHVIRMEHSINANVSFLKFHESCSIPVAWQMDLWLHGMGKHRPLPACVYQHIRTNYQSVQAAGYKSAQERA